MCAKSIDMIIPDFQKAMEHLAEHLGNAASTCLFDLTVRCDEQESLCKDNVQFAHGS